METKPVRGRFAPSPSGRMHLGNIFCALMAWLPVRAAGGEMVLRIEDLDPDRSRMAYAAQMEDDLTWFGMDWDEGGSKGGPYGPYYQSQRTQRYRRYFEELRAKGLVYPCYCTRGELHAAQAPHREDGAPIYSGRCRSLTEEERARLAQSRRPAYRLMVPDREIAFTDGCQGEFRENLLRDCGDFIIRRSDGVFAYQLAVVADDGEMGITQVVRGCDLLDSTPRQLYLYELLGLSSPGIFPYSPSYVPFRKAPLQAGQSPGCGGPPGQSPGAGGALGPNGPLGRIAGSSGSSDGPGAGGRVPEKGNEFSRKRGAHGAGRFSTPLSDAESAAEIRFSTGKEKLVENLTRIKALGRDAGGLLPFTGRGYGCPVWPRFPFGRQYPCTFL